jgi:RNA polymerase-binding protein DksA
MPRASKASRAAKPVKKTPARKAVAKTVKTVKKTTTGKAAPKKAVPVKKAATAKKAVPAKKAAPAAKAPSKQVAAKKAAAPAKKAAPAAPAAKKAAPAAKKAAPVKKAGKVVLDKFALEQRDLLQQERATYAEQAEALKAEADQLAAEMEPGDIQFDDESGEGATATVDRERDLALSAQARQEIEEIDYALTKIVNGTYGTCERCGQPIPKARLKAIPHARLCVACKSGGLSRR